MQTNPAGEPFVLRTPVPSSFPRSTSCIFSTSCFSWMRCRTVENAKRIPFVIWKESGTCQAVSKADDRKREKMMRNNQHQDSRDDSPSERIRLRGTLDLLYPPILALVLSGLAERRQEGLRMIECRETHHLTTCFSLSSFTLSSVFRARLFNG